MKKSLKLHLSFFLFITFASVAHAQTSLPDVYIDPQGNRYTRAQFDSLKTANMGKPIAMIDVFRKETEVQHTFEVYNRDPREDFKKGLLGKPLPAFSLKDSKGKVVDNASLKGKVVVLNLWSTTCAPCLLEMPHLSELVTKYESKDVVFLAPAPESLDKIRPVVARRGFTYQVLPLASSLFTALGIDGYPFHFVIGRDGLTQAAFSGSRVDAKTNEPVLDTRIIEAIDKAIGQ